MVNTNWTIPISVDQCLVVFDFYFDMSACPIMEGLQEEKKDSEEWDEDREKEEWRRQSIENSDTTQLEVPRST